MRPAELLHAAGNLSQNTADDHAGGEVSSAAMGSSTWPAAGGSFTRRYPLLSDGCAQTTCVSQSIRRIGGPDSSRPPPFPASQKK